MVQTGEARHVPDLTVARLVVIGVELPLIEELTARGAAVIVLAAAVNGYYFAEELRRRIETDPAQLAARRAALEAAWHTFWSGTSQSRHIVGACLAASLGQVAEHAVVALRGARFDEAGETALPRLEVRGVRP